MEQIRRALNMLQSSSPSYVLMGSLDAFQAQLRRRAAPPEDAEAMDLAADIRKMGCYELWQDRLPVGYPAIPQADHPSLRALDLRARGWLC